VAPSLGQDGQRVPIIGDGPLLCRPNKAQDPIFVKSLQYAGPSGSIALPCRAIRGNMDKCFRPSRSLAARFRLRIESITDPVDRAGCSPRVADQDWTMGATEQASVERRRGPRIREASTAGHDRP